MRHRPEDLRIDFTIHAVHPGIADHADDRRFRKIARYIERDPFADRIFIRKNLRAAVSLINATSGASGRSCSSNNRPFTSGVPSAAKYPGVTRCVETLPCFGSRERWLPAQEVCRSYQTLRVSLAQRIPMRRPKLIPKDFGCPPAKL